jgi:hypothetical protein
VPASEHGPLAEVRTEIVDQYSPVDVTSLRGSPFQPDRLHLLAA